MKRHCTPKRYIRSYQLCLAYLLNESRREELHWVADIIRDAIIEIDEHQIQQIECRGKLNKELSKKILT